ncbi:hypothetical protein PAXRUDRAFT_828700 [Paxillus rubicundulus Ve08.2h10]|uniref:Restriction of telomere capping protein 4 n=1 Tax=Paxillus rubicundulus Ve08.2h10 TaxID=930991 RepID=A0A0D0E0Y3_9AGAM|nr:hypothetical protein PAXRUDRAFT_828700 [Paxillus rubicundulus Ve08.2h10]
MENYIGKMKHENTDLFTDPRNRMSQRPLAVKTGEGLGFQDIGSSFDPPKPAKTYGKPRSKFKPSTTHSPLHKRRPDSYDSNEGSDDELLLLSSQDSRASDALSSPKRVAKGKSRVIVSEKEEIVRVNGRDLAAHPDYKPSSRQHLKGLHFKKQKKGVSASDIFPDEPPPSSSIQEESQDNIFKPISDELHLRSQASQDGLPSRQTPSTTFSARQSSPTITRPTARRLRDAKEPPSAKLASPLRNKTPQPTAKPRPKPRLVVKSAPRNLGASPESTPHSSTWNRALPLPVKLPVGRTVDAKAEQSLKKVSAAPSSRRELQEFPISLEAKENISDGTCSGDNSAIVKKGTIPHFSTLGNIAKRKAGQSLKEVPSSRRELQTFPMSWEGKGNVSDGTLSGDGSAKAKKRTISRSSTLGNISKPAPQPFPLKSGTKQISRGDTFPMLPLLTPSDCNPRSSLKGKCKARAESGDQDEDEFDLTIDRTEHTRPRPFPMSSHMLASIGQQSRSPASPKSTKRTSDDSDAERGRLVKKRKDSQSGALAQLEYLNDPPMEEDSVDLGYTRDPSTACPYCDEPLPSHPTPFLRNLLVTARTKSYPDPRPRNPRGLKAPLATYISACQRHRFESHQLPIAIERGWPKTIDFAKVPARVKSMKKELVAIILDGDALGDDENPNADDKLKGPRNRSVFWREMVNEVKKQGSRAVVGLKGQFASFEKTQPGYYGEQGSVIIHQTLFDLFPPSSFDVSLITPLAPAEFIQRILVPEAAVRLIAQDLCADIEDAIVTLRESAQYGVAMFPDTSENRRKGADVDDDEMGVADQIVMERARVRRKELEEEEKIEEEMLAEERAARRAKAREIRREKAMERAQQARLTKALAEDNDTSEQSEANVTRQTRRVTRQQTASTAEFETDVISVDSSTSRRSTRITRKSAQVNDVKTRSYAVLPQRDVLEITNESDDEEGKPPIRRRNVRERSTDLESDSRTVETGDRSKPLRIDEETESTPRPLRRQPTIPREEHIPIAQPNPATTIDLATSSNVRRLPLQMAGERTVTASAAHDTWYPNMRTTAPDDADSDTSNPSRRSQRLERRPQKSGGFDSWLFSEPSSSSSD